MKIDIRTGQPFSGEPPKNNKVVPIPLEKNAVKEDPSPLSAKVRELRKLVKEATPLKERRLSVEPSEKSLPGLVSRTAKLLRTSKKS